MTYNVNVNKSLQYPINLYIYIILKVKKFLALHYRGFPIKQGCLSVLLSVILTN